MRLALLLLLVGSEAAVCTAPTTQDSYSHCCAEEVGKLSCRHAWMHCESTVNGNIWISSGVPCL